MPRFTTPQGTYVYVPGVYSLINAISGLPGPLPNFMIPVIVGHAEEAAVPYTFASTKQAIEAAAYIFNPILDASGMKRAFGNDCDLAVAMRFAKLNGLGACYAIAGNALTRASVIATSTGPVVQGSFFAKKYGPAGGHILIKAASGTTFTVTGLRRYSLLTANAASGASRIYVKDNTWVSVGDTIYIGDNDSADATYVVGSIGTELSSTGQINYYIQLTTTLAAAIATAQYGMAFVYDTDNAETPAAFTSVQGAIDYFNGPTSKILGFQVNSGTFTNPAAFIAISSATPLKEISAWSTVTVGTCPAMATGDATALIALFQSTAWDEFCVFAQVVPQQFLILDSSATVHGLYRDWAIDKRAEAPAQPVGVMAGCAWGDTSTTSGTSTSPNYRASQLNNQDFALVANGINKLAAYVSTAACVFGKQIGGGVKHNLTNDELIGVSEWEIAWDERTLGQLTTLCKKGVITKKLSARSARIVWAISEGLSTLQNNTVAWNDGESPATTCLLQQRHLADFINAAVADALEESQIGGDGVDRDSIAAVCNAKAAQLTKDGYTVEDFTIISITLSADGAGWNVITAPRPPTTVDFIGLTTNILIG